MPKPLAPNIKHSWAGLCRCNIIIYLQNRVENLSLPPFVLALQDLPGEELLASSDKIKIKSLHYKELGKKISTHLVEHDTIYHTWSKRCWTSTSQWQWWPGLGTGSCCCLNKKAKNWVGKDIGKSAPPPSSIALFSKSGSGSIRTPLLPPTSPIVSVSNPNADSKYRINKSQLKKGTTTSVADPGCLSRIPSHPPLYTLAYSKNCYVFNEQSLPIAVRAALTTWPACPKKVSFVAYLKKRKKYLPEKKNI